MNRDCKALNAEVERLTKENAELKASGRQALDAGEETIERLTKELADALQRGVVLAIKSEKNEHRADALAAELAKAQEQTDALCLKVQTLAPHGTCGCSYDKPDDACLHHSPKLAAAEADLAKARAENTLLQTILDVHADVLARAALPATPEIQP
jgi:chromosome segregation ATPase